jgi:hypothetical protein
MKLIEKEQDKRYEDLEDLLGDDKPKANGGVPP